MEQKRKETTLEDLKKILEKCQKEKAEYLAGWQRSRADFLNYKKEEMERISEILKYAGEELILKILPILDNFDLAEKKLPRNNNDENSKGPLPPEEGVYGASIKGILQIKTQLQDFLKSQGVEEIKCLGKKFDPNFQEAVEEVEKKEVESGTVIEEIQKGYRLHGKVIRPAKVKVAK